MWCYSPPQLELLELSQPEDEESEELPPVDGPDGPRSVNGSFVGREAVCPVEVAGAGRRGRRVFSVMPSVSLRSPPFNPLSAVGDALPFLHAAGVWTGRGRWIIRGIHGQQELRAEHRAARR